MDAERVEAGRARWQARFDGARKREAEFRTLSGIDVEPVYGPEGGDPRTAVSEPVVEEELRDWTEVRPELEAYLEEKLKARR